MNPKREILTIQNGVIEARIDLKDLIPIYGVYNIAKKVNTSFEPEKGSTILDGIYHLAVASYQAIVTLPILIGVASGLENLLK